MPQLEHIDAIERRLWSAADTLRANSEHASNEYFLPVMGLVFLRHAYSRYLAVKDGIAAGLPMRGGRTRALTREDFSQRNALFLRPHAQFDHLVALPDGEDRAAAIIAAMESIEEDYDSLRGVLPKSEYQALDNEVLGDLLRKLNPDELKQVSGDVFGRIYEYFLTKFADQKAHDGGGVEKNDTTIRLAKMNLAVHGLEGDIRQAITYYGDPHELLGRADYVMANPPFNVDEIDADKVRTDPRLPFGLPGVNKKHKVGNGNYVWISYFYSYLNETGRAGFVMSSQASSAGGGEAAVRRKLVETGDVDVMIAIRSNFFYTRTVPCELWFLNRAKPEAHRDKVLMIDARSVYRKVTRKIYDFSPEQQQNLLAIVWLYRGDTARFRDLAFGYLLDVVEEGVACIQWEGADGQVRRPLEDFLDALAALRDALSLFLETQAQTGPHADRLAELDREQERFARDAEHFGRRVDEAAEQWEETAETNDGLNELVDRFAPLVESSRDLAGQADQLCRAAIRLIETCERECAAKSSDVWNRRDVTRARKAADEARREAVEQLRKVHYFWRQAHWLTERFPDGELRDVEGLVKLVDRTEIEANDWSLTPGRYVGVAPEEEDEDFDFATAMREIHAELADLNAEAAVLAARIQENFEKLGI